MPEGHAVLHVLSTVDRKLDDWQVIQWVDDPEHVKQLPVQASQTEVVVLR